jgi:Flp pilus assembly pilin Flp
MWRASQPQFREIDQHWKGVNTHMLITYFRSLLAQLVRGEEGQTAVEYGLVVALVCVVIVAALLTAMNGAMADVTKAITAAF